MGGLFDGTPLERPVTCERCERALAECTCPRDAAGELRLPADQPLRIRREKRRGKIVTVIAGFDAVATDLREILSSLKSAFAAGGTINGDCVEIQGDHRERAMAMLKEMGYPVKLAGG